MWDFRAVVGSLLRRRSGVSVVFMVAPLGMDRDFAISCSLAWLDFALLLRSVMDAAESIRAVLYIFGGLVQPEDIVLISLLIKLASIILFSSSGPPRQAPLGAFTYPEFHMIPPMGSWRVASLFWSSFLLVQVELVWLCASLYPWDQQ